MLDAKHEDLELSVVLGGSLKLKVSYDVLDEHEKIVFIYIACCFNRHIPKERRWYLTLCV